jgi:glycerol kinase
MNNQQQFILALDQGTTSSRSIIFDQLGRPVATAQKPFQQLFPQPGWVEHDANEIWSTQASVTAEVMMQVLAPLLAGSRRWTVLPMQHPARCHYQVPL